MENAKREADSPDSNCSNRDKKRPISKIGMLYHPCYENCLCMSAGAGPPQLQGEEALRAVIQNIAAISEAMLNTLPAILASATVDAVLLDTALF
jgi:hypothetical protein